ncbi:bifunctional alpha,alpha-trehalose-phosphate synthase (UDP-forming)/trehalose-phosphatase [Hymenobacter sp. NBH84]|uniref:bifunctional alpha,alpha-trehalose-phosphate synthase (UDP-forming)/trehalose-phosphatase n=1 Tax=Hymenobacter sp. NBH84 TaxID=2596915 RepID=UPI001625E360|nr:bifunctional alpha,alpha-trehalose-phosphate synthase (UDP-forming)/trehalose-phosphatase [Hymenobacter sp. NBH84]QNE39726.1 bifunctional alpha,alpha-trehalose-phosphate synthase (UDP-forming)/trehalose-phosphatase [Hymenobacter sp. NBH84]
MSRTIIVSNRLPTKVQRTDDDLAFTPSEGGLATGLGSIYRAEGNVWIGWPGLVADDETERQQITTKLQADSMQPVFLNDDEIKGFYEGFSNETLWPTFHYFSQYAVYNEQHWETYVAVNQKFCDAVLEAAGDDDTIWVHDYQLLLLPQMLRKARPHSTIGFFLHIPFPSYELLRALPWRTQLLEGMLGADLIGFHTFGYMRHFLSSVSQLLGYPSQNGRLELKNRTVLIDAFPMGIDYERYANAAASEVAQEHEQNYLAALPNARIILSIDRLDYTKGIAQRLRAFELLLQRYPEWQGRATLIMLVVPSRDQVAQYQELKEEIDELVGRINADYRTITWNPIHYFYRSLPLEELTALYRMAEVALVTPIRDGMNLVSKEFIASKADRSGVLILSERAGAARELSDALLINPSDMNQLAEAMHEALEMPEEEQKMRLANMQALVQHYNVYHWTELFMNRLAYTKIKQMTLATEMLDATEATTLRQQYTTASQRLLLLDYDGTLAPFHPNPQKAAPSAEILETLTTLSADPHNRVVIISGRDRQTLQKWLGHLPVDFIAEHGVWLRAAGQDWTLFQPMRNDWMKEIRPTLELYVSRTAGSFIEDKDFSLVWHYRRADAELAAVRVRELISHLSFLTSNSDLQVLEGNKVIEIKAAGLNKGTAAARWVATYQPDFILAIGDDRTDEDTFGAMPKDAFTIKVGRNSRSLARFHVPGTTEVQELLQSLAEVSVPQ